MITLTKHESDAVLAGLAILTVILVPVMIRLETEMRRIEREIEQLLKTAAERAAAEQATKENDNA